jgi:hypothetical protein
VDVADLGDLDSLIKRVELIPDVLAVARLTPAAASEQAGAD